MNAKQSCELIKKERKNFVGKKDIEYLEKDIILKRAKMNVIEEDGISRYERIIRENDKHKKINYFDVRCPKEDTGECTFRYCVKDGIPGELKETPSYRILFEKALTDFRLGLERVERSQGLDVEKFEFMYEFRFHRRRIFTMHYDLNPRHYQEEFLIVEHIKERDGYYRVYYDSFEHFFSEFPLRTYRQERWLEKVKNEEWGVWRKHFN